ncbi:MAG: hypothetical protein ABL895_03565 [Cyclobacteriaceae bacterium]
MKNKFRKILLVLMFLVSGAPALVSFVNEEMKADNEAYAQTMGYFRLDVTCYYMHNGSLKTGSQCNVSGTGCNIFLACG